MLVSVGPFVLGPPSRRPLPCVGELLLQAPVCGVHVCLAALTCRIASCHFFQFCPSALLVSFIFFISLNSYLSVSPSLGPRNTVIIMTIEALVLPPLHNSQGCGICPQTGGETAIQQWPPQGRCQSQCIFGAEASLNQFGCLFLFLFS